ncbi:sugar porter family MFS transporter [Rothia sp. ZJ1223]|uniref:sugar porter family MFS transporter n=1 Tax=Rothia sp. ZJ1223 TaxID=2811098 RepID=UPI00195C91C0|nr:sugar porter family MFS transporter [Rothia sp. ZJ1223]MBM7052092.1 sugar porter family MFS transporter [Rothia sp. ZJ1223]
MQQTPAPRRSRLNFYTWIVTLGGFLFGYDTGIINGALPFLQDQFVLSPVAEGITTSSLTLGAALGAVTVGQLVDRFGRRRVLFVLALVFILGSAGIAFSSALGMLIAFRVIVGLAVGAASAVVPLYLAEIAPAAQRGAIVTRNQFMIVTGQLLAYSINAALGNIFLHETGIWRIMFALSIAPAIALFIGMFAVPESPRWLLRVGRTSDAQLVLENTVDDTPAELAALQRSLAAEENRSTATLRDLFASPALRSTLLVGATIGIVQQITGVNALMYYGTQVLRESGFATDAALTANIANGVISVIGAALGIWFVGKLPRRATLTIGLAGTTASLLALALISSFVEGGARAWAVLTVSVIFLVFQQGAVSPVTWVLMSEVFPSRVRGAGMGAATFVSWLANFAVSFSFPQIVAAFGLGITFALFAVLGVAAIWFVRAQVPETAGRSLEDIVSI